MLKRRALRGMLNRLRKTVILIGANPFASEWVRGVERPYRLQRSPVEVRLRGCFAARSGHSAQMTADEF
jgi:hypothetical protein